MALYSTKVHFVMHSATTATEHLQTYAKHVYAEPLSPQKMTSMPNQRESPLSDTMKCVTSQLSFSPRYVDHEVRVESRLQPLSGGTLSINSVTTEHNARLDAAVSGLILGRKI